MKPACGRCSLCGYPCARQRRPARRRRWARWRSMSGMASCGAGRGLRDGGGRAGASAAGMRLGLLFVLTFGRCAAYAADQDADSTAVGWAKSYDSAAGAWQAALAECRSRAGGSGCVVRAWGCNGPVVEDGLNLDRAARRRISRDCRRRVSIPVARTVCSVRGRGRRFGTGSWRAGHERRGYLNGPSVAALRSADGSAPSASPPPTAQAPSTVTAAPTSAATAAQENLFWRSIVNSTNPADFAAYLAQFPTGVFRSLAQNRLTALRQPSGAPTTAGTHVEGAGSPSFRLSGLRRRCAGLRYSVCR